MAQESNQQNALNENQQRSLVATGQYINRLLGDLERAFVEAQSNSPFGRFVNDVAPAEERLVHDYIGRIRTQLVRVLAGQDLSHGTIGQLTRYLSIRTEEVPAAGLERILGRGLGHSIIAKRLERAVGDAVKTTLESYGSVLRRWALDNLEDIRVEWAATTDALRAHLDRELGHGQGDSVRGDEIARDLRRLGRPPERDDPAGAATRALNA